MGIIFLFTFLTTFSPQLIKMNNYRCQRMPGVYKADSLSRRNTLLVLQHHHQTVSPV